MDADAERDVSNGACNDTRNGTCTAAWLLRRTVRNHPERSANLIEARTTATLSGAPVYVIEYTVDAPGYGATHHLCALSVARSESHVTLSYRVPEARWRASEAEARQAVGSLDVLL